MNLIDPAELHRLVRELRTTVSHGGTAHTFQPSEKSYPRMPQIKLPAIETLEKSLSETIFMRQSLSEKDAQLASGSFPRHTISNLLGNAVAARDHGKRGYPSGGGLNPIEMYLVGTIEGEKCPMVYHFSPGNHVLEELWETSDVAIGTLTSSEHTVNGTHALILTARWGQSSQKYGGFAYYLSLLEAGHLAQNVLLCATALDTPARVIGGFNDHAVSTLLDLPTCEEDPLYIITLAPKAS